MFQQVLNALLHLKTLGISHRDIKPENIICDGCMANEPMLIDRNCPVRPCVIDKGLENCSSCDEYICEKLKERIVEFMEVKNRVGKHILEADYICFIQPYENKRRLDFYWATGEVVR